MKKTFILLLILVSAVVAIIPSCKKERSCITCITIPDYGYQNKAPIASAGPDQVIFLPTARVRLNGSASSDPDSNITAYKWTRISGPLSFHIQYPDSVQTLVSDLIQGFYQFELKVTDAGSLVSTDTVGIRVVDGGNSEVIFSDQVWINQCYDPNPGACAINGDAPSYGFHIRDTNNILPDSAFAIVGVWIRTDNSNAWEQVPHNCWEFPGPYPQTNFTFCLTPDSLSVYSWFYSPENLAGRKADLKVLF